MEPGSQIEETGEQTTQKFASLLGTFIALLTLAIPIFAISHFSSANSDNLQTPAQVLPQARD